VIPNIALSTDSIKNANKICEKVDIEDVSFVALANDMNKPLLTRDEKLYTGLRKQGYRNIIMFGLTIEFTGKNMFKWRYVSNHRG
jgi:predicted nucleic acid-binding protein